MKEVLVDSVLYPVERFSQSSLNIIVDDDFVLTEDSPLVFQFKPTGGKFGLRILLNCSSINDGVIEFDAPTINQVYALQYLSELDLTESDLIEDDIRSKIEPIEGELEYFSLSGDNKDIHPKSSRMRYSLVAVIVVVLLYAFYQWHYFSTKKGIVVADAISVEADSKLWMVNPEVVDKTYLKKGEVFAYIPTPELDAKISFWLAGITDQKVIVSVLRGQDVDETKYWKVRFYLDKLNHKVLLQEVELEKANLKVAKQKLTRSENLFKDALVSKEEVEASRLKHTTAELSLEFSQLKAQEAYAIMDSSDNRIHTRVDSSNGFESSKDKIRYAQSVLKRLMTEEKALQRQKLAYQITSPCDCIYLEAWSRHKDYLERIYLVLTDGGEPSVYPIFPIKLEDVSSLSGNKIDVTVYTPNNGKHSTVMSLSNWVYTNSILLGLPDSWQLDNMWTIKKGGMKLDSTLIGNSISVRETLF